MNAGRGVVKTFAVGWALKYLLAILPSLLRGRIFKECVTPGAVHRAWRAARFAARGRLDPLAAHPRGRPAPSR